MIILEFLRQGIVNNDIAHRDFFLVFEVDNIVMFKIALFEVILDVG